MQPAVFTKDMFIPGEAWCAKAGPRSIGEKAGRQMFREVDARGQPYSRGRLARETGIYLQYAHTFWSLDHFQIHQPVQPQHFSKIKQCDFHLSHEGR